MSLMRYWLSSVIAVAACSPTPPPQPNAAPSPDPPPPAQTSSTALTSTPTPTVPERYTSIVASADRTAEDRALDAGRHPAELLAFFGLTDGMRVAELGSGGGYTSELFARAVGPTGKVFGQNTKMILEKFAEKPWSARLVLPSMKNVVRVDREFDAPLPPEATNLDGVYLVLIYHDLYWMKVDRAKMNKAIFDALKPGGAFGIVDHASKAGAGATEVQTLHRIEEREVRADIEKAGFKLDKEGSFLRTSSDTKDWSTSPGAAGEKRGTSDRFVLLFRKPG
jgi:predicted methyltransferase